MANQFNLFFRKKLLGKNKNLVSFDEAYSVMAHLLRGHRIIQTTAESAS
jgi:hypothetical protein